MHPNRGIGYGQPVSGLRTTPLNERHRAAGAKTGDFGGWDMPIEYAGTVAALGPGVDEFQIGERVAVEMHKGCDCCENCIKGWYTSCLNYGNLAKGHRAKGLTCDGGFAEYAVAAESALAPKPPQLSFAQASTIPQAGAIALQGTAAAAAEQNTATTQG